MSQKNVVGIPRRRSSSRKKWFVRRGTKKSNSVRARIQSSGTLKALSESYLTIAPLNTKYNLVKETSVCVGLPVCNLERIASRNPWNKLKNSSRFPRSWDTHILVLGEKELYSATPAGVLETPIPYEDIETWMAVSIPRLPLSYIKASVKTSSFLIQTPDTYQREGLLHSVQWKRNICQHVKVLNSATHPEVVLQELQNLVKNAVDGPLCLDDTHNTLLEIVSNVLNFDSSTGRSVSNESLILTLAPLFEQNQPSIEICNFFKKHCHDCPRSCVVIDLFNPVVQRVLKSNMNFSKTMWLRTFVKEYIQALNSQNDGEAAVRAFVRALHGPLTICPHRLILNNLVAVCLSAIYDSFVSMSSVENDKEKKPSNLQKGSSAMTSHRASLEYGNENVDHEGDKSKNELWKSSKVEENISANIKNNSMDIVRKVNLNLNVLHEKDENVPQKSIQEKDVTAILFAKVLDEISLNSDWLPGLAVLLQPVSIQDEALKNEKFVGYITQIIGRMIQDGREQVIWCLMSPREQKDGWLQVFSPRGNMLQDNGKLFINMTTTLLESAKNLGKTMRLVAVLLNTSLNDVLLLALRESKTMIEVLYFILDYHLVSGKRRKRIESTLRSTTLGKVYYERMFENATVMEQKGGPDEYHLPPQSTDQDLHKFLSNGFNGNLTNLDLSFTHVSCKSADIIGKLPALQHLNLWSSDIRDAGLRKLCESLNLKSLNLCETLVTDDGIKCLKNMTNLTDLNLSDTLVSDRIYLELRSNLPNLVRCNMAYTEVKQYGEVINAMTAAGMLPRHSRTVRHCVLQ